MTNYVGASGNVYAREDKTASATPAGCLVAVYRNTAGHKPKYAFVQCELFPIRYTRDGSVPAEATPVGQLLPVGVPLMLVAEAQISRFSFVSGTGGNAKVQIEYFE